MRKGKWLRRVLYNRVFFLSLAMVAQLLFFVFIVKVLLETSLFAYELSILLSVAAVVWIVNDGSNPAYKLSWIVLILVFPIFGGAFYFFFGRVRLNRRLKARLLRRSASVEIVPGASPEPLEKLEALDWGAGLQARYLQTKAGSPLWEASLATYFSTGETAYEAILRELEKAERSIYLEFFIVGEGRMWDGVLEILRRKAAAGLDVRVMYDDFGCMGRLPPRYARTLEAMGIRCTVFNPLKPILSLQFNHRDHRKILVVDGKVGFTGGINLADEYINAVERFGHWKDDALMVEGDAAASFETMFLRLWEGARPGDGEEAGGLRASAPVPLVDRAEGFVQPFEDSPLDEELVGENVYLGLINRARRYVYATTPYLILDAEMTTAFRLAAKSGVDVRIMTPHLPDKWYVHAVTRANYLSLLEAGVRIFEYGPGFVHSKTLVADDDKAVVGTINLDFRSLYLHFECGVALYRCQAVEAVRDDFLSTLESCVEMKAEELRAEPLPKRLLGWTLKLFAPFM